MNNDETQTNVERRLLIDRAWTARHDINGHDGPNISRNYEDGWDDAMAHINGKIGIATLKIITELCDAKTPHCPKRIAGAMRDIFSLLATGSAGDPNRLVSHLRMLIELHEKDEPEKMPYVHRSAFAEQLKTALWMSGYEGQPNAKAQPDAQNP